MIDIDKKLEEKLSPLIDCEPFGKFFSFVLELIPTLFVYFLCKFKRRKK